MGTYAPDFDRSNPGMKEERREEGEVRSKK